MSLLSPFKKVKKSKQKNTQSAVVAEESFSANTNSSDNELENIENPFAPSPVFEPEQKQEQEPEQEPQTSSSLDSPNLDSPHLEGQDVELLAADYKVKIKRSLLQVGGLLKESHALIAFQAGGFGLHGTLITNARNQSTISDFATSSSVDFTRAISEVMAQFKKRHKRLPKRTILLTPSVVSDLVYLPVSPLRPRSKGQMQELIRWELESAISQQNVQWKVGSILVARGHMTAKQRNHVLEELAIGEASGGQSSMARFGDTAIQLGYIQRECLDDCFALQGKLVAIDDDLEYGWQASEQIRSGPSDETLLTQEEDSDSSHPWLVCGMSKTVRRRWMGAFNLNGLSLEAFYPTVGSAFAGLSQHCDDEKQLLLEVYQEQLALVSGDHRIITGITSKGRQVGDLSASECLELLEGHTKGFDRVYLASNGVEDIHGLLSQLVQSLNIEVQQLSAPAQNLDLPVHIRSEALLGLHGVSNHFLKHIPAKRLSCIGAKDATKKPMKDVFTFKRVGIFGGVSAVCGMAGFLVWMYWSTTQHEARLQALDDDYNKQMRLKQRLNEVYGDSLELQVIVKQAKKDLIMLKELVVVQQANAGYRQQTIQSLLKVFVLGLDSGTAMGSVSKSGDNFALHVSTASNLQGQEFVNKIDQLAKPVRYQVSNSEVTLNKGQALPYKVSLTLSYTAGLSRDFETALQKVDSDGKVKP